MCVPVNNLFITHTFTFANVRFEMHSLYLHTCIVVVVHPNRSNDHHISIRTIIGRTMCVYIRVDNNRLRIRHYIIIIIIMFASINFSMLHLTGNIFLLLHYTNQEQPHHSQCICFACIASSSWLRIILEQPATTYPQIPAYLRLRGIRLGGGSLAAIISHAPPHLPQTRSVKWLCGFPFNYAALW